MVPPVNDVARDIDLAPATGPPGAPADPTFPAFPVPNLPTPSSIISFIIVFALFSFILTYIAVDFERRIWLHGNVWRSNYLRDIVDSLPYNKWKFIAVDYRLVIHPWRVWLAEKIHDYFFSTRAVASVIPRPLPPFRPDEPWEWLKEAAECSVVPGWSFLRAVDGTWQKLRATALTIAMRVLRGL
ncbi:hypothetical protein QBC35DRAFT_499216, partial [Podospora australis]